MRLDTIQPGQLLARGRRDDLKNGGPVLTVIALAVGNYRETNMPCGKVVVQDERASRGVVVAHPVHYHRGYKHRGRGQGAFIEGPGYTDRDDPWTPAKQEWEPRVLRSTDVEHYDIWLESRDLVTSMEVKMRHWKEEGQDLRRKVYASMANDMADGTPLVIEDASTLFSTDGRRGQMTVLLGTPITEHDQGHVQVDLVQMMDARGGWSEATHKAIDLYNEWCDKPRPDACNV